MSDVDLFGNTISSTPTLRDKFIEPPFSVFDTKTSHWQTRKRLWRNLCITGGDGRDKGMVMGNGLNAIDPRTCYSGTSIFDPALCEIMYKWFCPDRGAILDPFCGGSVRGIVANYLGYNYTGIDIRQEQIDSNRKQAQDILELNNQPNYYVGDSRDILHDHMRQFDFVFSCPPYHDLEHYSDLENDLSNMSYDDFIDAYREIIKLSVGLLKDGCFACFVVGDIRDNKGNYRGFIGDTIKAFADAGMSYYNEAILLESGLNTAAMRADRQFTSGKKLVKIHQNILIFKK